MISLATFEGNVLKNSWYYVLDCISKIDHMHVLGLGMKKDSDFFQAHKNMSRAKSKRAIERETIVLHNSDLIANNIELSKIDLIIQRSIHLDADAIVDFI